MEWSSKQAPKCYIHSSDFKLTFIHNSYFTRKCPILNGLFIKLIYFLKYENNRITGLYYHFPFKPCPFLHTCSDGKGDYMWGMDVHSRIMNTGHQRKRDYVGGNNIESRIMKTGPERRRLLMRNWHRQKYYELWPWKKKTSQDEFT